MDKKQSIEALRSQMNALLESSAPHRAGLASKAAGATASGSHPGSHPAKDNAKTTGAFKKLVELVNASDKSEKAIRSRLLSHGFPEAETDEAISRAKGYGFIDDMRYADVLIRSRIAQGKGSLGIERELRENDIDLSAVPGWPFDYGIDDVSEFQRALDVLARKPPKAKNARDAAYRKLMQKGFPSSIASSAARQWSESMGQ